MCNFEVLSSVWETNWDTADTDTQITTLHPFNGMTIQVGPMQFIHIPLEEPDKKPKKKSKWLEKKLRRYE